MCLSVCLSLSLCVSGLQAQCERRLAPLPLMVASAVVRQKILAQIHESWILRQGGLKESAEADSGPGPPSQTRTHTCLGQWPSLSIGGGPGR